MIDDTVVRFRSLAAALSALALALAPSVSGQTMTLAQPGACRYAACGTGGACFLNPLEVSADEALQHLMRLPHSRDRASFVPGHAGQTRSDALVQRVGLRSEPATRAPSRRGRIGREDARWYTVGDLTDRVALTGNTDFRDELVEFARRHGSRARSADNSYRALSAARRLGLTKRFLLDTVEDHRSTPRLRAAAVRVLAEDPDAEEYHRLARDFESHDGVSAYEWESLSAYAAALAGIEAYHEMTSPAARARLLTAGAMSGQVWAMSALRDFSADNEDAVQMIIRSLPAERGDNPPPPDEDCPMADSATESQAFLRAVIQAPPTLVASLSD